MNHPIELSRLVKFLKKSNKETYANKAALKAPSTRPGSEDYHFEADGLVYHDTYWGSRNFLGGEQIWLSEDFAKQAPAKWGMNYFGFVLDSNVNEGELYNFLREALMQPEDDVKIPVRGPVTFSKGNKRYWFSVKGDLTNFNGLESISIDNRVVYRCRVHGGFI
ncbi:XRE family transcriptional regulator [Candidatus Pacearchaeota archaeon]|nr:XRE family transcriptional regulator [Candidatus Pacearchaeota archaeon]